MKKHKSLEARSRILAYSSFRIDIIDINLSVTIGGRKEGNVPCPSYASESYLSRAEKESTVCILKYVLCLSDAYLAHKCLARAVAARIWVSVFGTAIYLVCSTRFHTQIGFKSVNAS